MTWALFTCAVWCSAALFLVAMSKADNCDSCHCVASACAAKNPPDLCRVVAKDDAWHADAVRRWCR